jgi:hypothetical protein
MGRALAALPSLQKGGGRMEQFYQLLNLWRKTFICLRCGECCFAWAVRMPDGSIKPERQNCQYLIPRHKIGNKWQVATCKIHDTPDYPQDCKQAILGPTYCPLGSAIWKLLKDENPEDVFPEEVEKAIEFYYGKK